MKTTSIKCFLLLIMHCLAFDTYAQDIAKDSSAKAYKNVVRYNLSGALLFGFDKYIVLGYERILSTHSSISVNVGSAALPRLLSIVTDSFQTSRQSDRKGFNASIDYRFYLAKENKFNAPRGLYIGPYYSFNRFEDDQQWIRRNSSSNNEITTSSTFNINTFGFEMGYQLILWKRLSLDMVLVGPGLGFYKYKASFTDNLNLSAEDKEQLFEALKQRLTQRFPGMNFVISDQNIDADGVIKTRNIGYRYIVHIGYTF